MSNESLASSPFSILRVTPRDGKEQILEAADNASLSEEVEVVNNARSVLINPKNRLSAEVSWLPGLSPRRSAELLQLVRDGPEELINIDSIPKLAKVNLLSDAFIQGAYSDQIDFFSNALEVLTEHINSLDMSEIMRDINEDRVVSKFPMITDEGFISDSVELRIQSISRGIRQSLDDLPTDQLVSVMTVYAEGWTSYGTSVNSHFAELLIDGYEIQAQTFLNAESEAIKNLCKFGRSKATLGGRELEKVVADLDVAVRNWDRVAQPCQLLSEARGLNHDASRDLGFALRSFMIDLHNEFGQTEQSKQLGTLLADVFSEIPELAERIDQDIEALNEIEESSKRSDKERRERLEALAYEAEIGLVFKETLKLTADHISYGAKSFALKDITRVRWGAIRNSVNGIPTGTDYTIGFGDSRSEAVVSLRRSKVFEEFTDRLWKAVGIELLFKIIGELREGRIYKFQNLSISDEYAELTKKGGFFSSSDTKRFSWAEVSATSYGGEFYVMASADQKFSGGMSYIETANAHVFEALIRSNLKNSKASRLSDTFKGQ